MKILAFYLPQFHEIPENNAWWGEGFTEWVNVKAAQPLFDGHRQPRVPYNNDYYSLDDVSVMDRQATLAKKYGIDGFCFYHYWFGGKRLLDAPLLRILSNPEIEIEFCLSWANEPWARTWDGRDTEVLMPQNYGDESDWQAHFDYLSPFFMDERYLKVDGKPVFVIYKAKDVERLDEMLAFWNVKAFENGFTKGLHIVETLGGKQYKPASSLSAATLEFEPSLSLGFRSNLVFWAMNKLKMFFRRGLYRMDYIRVVKQSVNRSKKFKKDNYLGCFPGWDNTPRKKEKGVVFEGESVDVFEYYLTEQLRKSQKDSLIFINAWNEWAEGAYLEPDEDNEFNYLKAVERAKAKLGCEA